MRGEENLRERQKNTKSERERGRMKESRAKPGGRVGYKGTQYSWVKPSLL